MAAETVTPATDENEMYSNIKKVGVDNPNGPTMELDDQNVDVCQLSNRDSAAKAAVRNERCNRCLACCKPCMLRYNPLSDNPTKCEKIKYVFLCPPHGKLARFTTLILATLAIWGVLWAITGPQALPGGNLFGITILLIAAVLGGELVSKIRLPPLLGMLLVGGILKNVPKINIANDINPQWSSSLRSIALVVILIRAGLGLDPVALRKLSFGVIRLAFIPCLIETLSAAVCSHFLLGFPWIWGFILGFVLAAVSPAVVVPSMLALSEKGFGVAKGIPTLIIAAASVDDVLAISGFGIVLGMAFADGNIALTIVKGPLEALLGIVYGIVFGLICWYIPHNKHGNKTLFQFIILFFGGLFAQFGAIAANLSGAGALGCLSLAFVVGIQWRKDVPEGDNPKVSVVFAYLWVIMQPLLFGLIGAEVDISTIEIKTIGLGIALLFIGLAFRLVASFLAVFGIGLNLREQLFIPLAWLPKATVQAAIGSGALDIAREKNDIEGIKLGTQILTIAVLVIIITAPIGAIAISLSGPRLLARTTSPAVTSTSQPIPKKPQKPMSEAEYDKYDQVIQV